MREIKFRAWCESKHRYFMPEEMAADQFTLLSTGSFINVSGQSTMLSRIFTHDEYLPEQFTGLKDKNGKEIYEGDICKHPKGRIAPVVWNDDLLAWDFDSNPYVCDQEDGGVRGGAVEVIGNIHENLELLK